MRRGQAAIEFLTTYGWAFLVILVMIGALAYFGVLNPSKITPEKCIMTPGFDCRDYRVTANSIDIILYNRLGEGITLNDATVTSDAGSVGTCINTTTGLADANITITCTGSDFAKSVGSKVKVEFTLSYIKARDAWSKTASGSIYAQVQ